MRSRTLFILVVTVATLPAAPLSHAAGAGVRLERTARQALLREPPERVDEVITALGAGTLVRSSDFWHPEKQSVQFFDEQGRVARRIGSFSPSPGGFFRLKDIALTADGTVWVADVIGRLSFFRATGQLLGTMLVQNPGYQVDGLAIDEARGVFYLSGCLPTSVYVDKGCSLIHQYRLADRTYLRSFLATDPEALSKNLVGLQDVAVALDAHGRVFAADAPVLKLNRIEPDTGRVRTFPIASRRIQPVGRIELSSAAARAAYRDAYLIDRVAVAGEHVVVSVRRPAAAGYLLAVFTLDGEQVAVDLPSPGQLVGKTPAGELLFGAKIPEGYEVGRYRLGIQPAGSGGRGSR